VSDQGARVTAAPFSFSGALQSAARAGVDRGMGMQRFEGDRAETIDSRPQRSEDANHLTARKWPEGASLMTSLAELRAIEEERIAAERAAVLAAADAKRRAAEEAEARRVAEEAARIAAEREAAIAVAQAREAAEREARLKVETAEATERARLAASLEAQRLAGELELRRAVVAKKRPTWMVAVTAVAVLATGAAAWVAIDRMQASDAAIASKEAADSARAAAIASKLAAGDELVSAQRELVALGGKIDGALADLDRARTIEEKRRAEDSLRRLHDEQRAAEVRRQKALDDAERAKRNGGLHFTENCKHNALATECL
jgi:fused signal recognition particle receptor